MTCLPKSLADLSRDFSRAIERGKGVRLEAADVDTLCAAGIIENLAMAAAAEQRAQSRERLQARAEAPSSTNIVSGETGAQAVARARRTRRRPS